MSAMTMFTKRIELLLLITILLLGFVFRIWGLGSAEIFHDEGLYAFRSIGYVDYFQNEDQSTPIQWFKDSAVVPWWTKLSFHDAPPLFFLVQHLFFRVFGTSLFVARLPSLIAGIFAIWLMFLIGRRFWKPQSDRGVVFAAPCEHEELLSQKQMWILSGFRGRTRVHDWHSRRHGSPQSGESVARDPERDALGRARQAKSPYLFLSQPDLFGLLAALLLSINHIHIWISRTSIIESLLVTLMLANIYFFLRFVEDKKWWFLFGLTLGLAFLLKYNSIILIPVYAAYLILYRRPYFLAKELYFAIGAATIIFSPVLLYNYYLYTTVHHFDLQMAYFFKQATPEWRASLGKTQEPFAVFVPNMLAMYSKSFLLAVAAGMLAMLFFWNKTPREHRRFYLFALSGIVFVTLLLINIGVAYRFLTLYVPFVVFVAAFVFIIIWRMIPQKIVFAVLFFGFVTLEIWFSIGGIFLEFPRLGVIELDRYLSEEIGSARSSALVKSPNPHLNAIIQRYYNKLPKGDAPVLIIYDENTVMSPKLWLFARRLYYEGIPAVTVGQFNSIISQQGPGYFKSYKIYFIKANENSVMINTNLFYSKDANNLENFLKKEFNLDPIKTIYGFQPSNQGLQQIPMFYVYKILF